MEEGLLLGWSVELELNFGGLRLWDYQDCMDYTDAAIRIVDY